LSKKLKIVGYIKFLKTNKCTLVLWCNFIILWPLTCFGYSCGHIHSGMQEYRYIYVYIVSGSPHL